MAHVEMKKKKAPKAKKQKNGRAKFQPKAAWGAGETVGGFSGVKVTNLSGQADVEEDMLRYETTSAFTATGGAASYLQLKGNSIYRQCRWIRAYVLAVQAVIRFAYGG